MTTTAQINVGDGTYLEVELLPRHDTWIENGHRLEARQVEAAARLRNGPAGGTITVFEPKLLRQMAWTLLTASHRLERLQGPADEPDADTYPPLPFGTTIEVTW